MDRYLRFNESYESFGECPVLKLSNLLMDDKGQYVGLRFKDDNVSDGKVYIDIPIEFIFPMQTCENNEYPQVLKRMAAEEFTIKHALCDNEGSISLIFTEPNDEPIYVNDKFVWLDQPKDVTSFYLPYGVIRYKNAEFTKSNVLSLVTDLIHDKNFMEGLGISEIEYLRFIDNKNTADIFLKSYKMNDILSGKINLMSWCRDHVNIQVAFNSLLYITVTPSSDPYPSCNPFFHEQGNLSGDIFGYGINYADCSVYSFPIGTKDKWFSTKCLSHEIAEFIERLTNKDISTLTYLFEMRKDKDYNCYIGYEATLKEEYVNDGFLLIETCLKSKKMELLNNISFGTATYKSTIGRTSPDKFFVYYTVEQPVAINALGEENREKVLNDIVETFGTVFSGKFIFDCSYKPETQKISFSIALPL